MNPILRASVTILLVALSEPGGGQVAIAPEFRRTEPCVGSLKAYKVRTVVRGASQGFISNTII